MKTHRAATTWRGRVLLGGQRKRSVGAGTPKDYDYGMRDFGIKDPDGNLIGIGQEGTNS
jgi:hypothetical protein